VACHFAFTPAGDLPASAQAVQAPP